MKRKEGEKSENVTQSSLTSSIPYVVNTYVCLYLYLCARNDRSIRYSFSPFAMMMMMMMMMMMIERAYAFAFSHRRLNYNRSFRETGTETAGRTSILY